jgi:hypothetical protein
MPLTAKSSITLIKWVFPHRQTALASSAMPFVAGVKLSDQSENEPAHEFPRVFFGHKRQSFLCQKLINCN